MIKKPSDINEITIKYGIIPPSGYLAIILFGVLYINKKNKTYWEEYPEVYKKWTMNHEYIHLKQAQRDKSWFVFYCKYLWWWIKAMFLSGFKNSIAYYCIPYEVEAFMFEADPGYNCTFSKIIQRVPIKTLVTLKKRTKTLKEFILAIKNSVNL